jgi:hypothetical protein
MILATIVTSLAVYLGLGTDADPEMLDVMGSGDTIENDGDEQLAVNTESQQPTEAYQPPKIGTPIQPPPVQKGKKKVADDWDASEDNMAAEEDFLADEAKKSSAVSDEEEYEKLMNVYKAFRKLKTQFDEKFYAIWA